MDILVNPYFSYWYSAKQRYYEITGKKLNYRHPHDINEKLMWLTRYWQHPLKTKCADKYLVRQYLAENGLEELLVPLIAVYDNAEEINFDILPKSFVLKCNHGSGFNIIIRDKALINTDEIRRKLNNWMLMDYDKLAQEIHYHNIPHKILCEEFISESPTEYQIRMINGKAENILVCNKSENDYTENAYNIDWTECHEYISKTKRKKYIKPKNFDSILKYASILAKPFPFVRADFYDVNGHIYFAELTFTPAGNILEYDEKKLLELGEKLILPEKYCPSSKNKV